jgi:hypothetical protein
MKKKKNEMKNEKIKNKLQTQWKVGNLKLCAC